VEIPETPEEIRVLISFYAQHDDWWVIIDPPDAFFELLSWTEKLKKYLKNRDIGLFISPTKMQIFMIPKKLLPFTLIFEKFPDKRKLNPDKGPYKNFICFKIESLDSLKEWLKLPPGVTIQ